MEENNMRLKELELEIELEKLKITQATKTSSDELNELFGALSKAQGEFSAAPLNKSNPYYKSKYADLSALIGVSKDALCKNGLCVIQNLVEKNDSSYLCTRLGHASGQWIESLIKIQPQKPDVQSLGSYLTYVRRYSYASILGLFAGEDDDGEGAVARCITKEQLSEILKEVGSDKDLLKKALKLVKLADFADLQPERFEGCLTWIKKQKENNHENS